MTYENEATTPSAFFGTVTIKDECRVAGCYSAAVAAVPIRTPQETGVWWLCDDHAAALKIECPELNIGEIVRTCGVQVVDVPCGALATAVRILGVVEDQRPELMLASVCERHR